MKKLFILSLLVAALTLLLITPVFAAGWIGVTTSTDSPHLGFANTTNLCKVCHAVHGANATSYRLLHNASRDAECMYCHAPSTGASGKKVYDITGKAAEHTVAAIDATNAPAEGAAMPDSTKTIPERGSDSNKFNCFSCHTVHGANRVTASGLNSKIVRNDPAGDTGTATSEQEFCGDCHNANLDGADTHPMRAAATMEVYGADTVVAWDDSGNCFKCHKATKGHDHDPLNVKPSEYPHQSTGASLLADGTVSTELDEVCLSCHVNPANSAQGVGQTY